MVHELSQYAFDLPSIEDWLAGDDRTLAFQVVDGDGNGVDISNATVRWNLTERAYQDPADATISGSDSDVTLVTSSGVDPSIGEWEVQVDGSATDDLWGEYAHHLEVEQSDGTVAKWVGDVVLTA